MTVTGLPLNAGTESVRNERAMQLPVIVPANGAPLTVACVTRPDGANVTATCATPDGSSPARHAEAVDTAAVRALDAALRSKAATVGTSGAAAAAGAMDGRSVEGVVIDGVVVDGAVVDGAVVDRGSVATVGGATTGDAAAGGST